MANEEQLAILRQGVEVWNKWREEHPQARIKLAEANLRDVDLSKANLSDGDLREADLRRSELSGCNLKGSKLTGASLKYANLQGSDLTGTDLVQADLSKANLTGVDLRKARIKDANLKHINLTGAKLIDADLRGADLGRAKIDGADFTDAMLRETVFRKVDFRNSILNEVSFSGADMRGANLSQMNLRGINFFGADLRNSDLTKADLTEAVLTNADLSRANLTEANLTKTILSKAKLIGTIIDKVRISESNIYGVNVWDLQGQFEEQRDLIITPDEDSIITVDNVEVAQFVYLLLNNQKIRNVIDTVTTKTVLILGRFYDERKQVLDALKEALRKRGFVPILFDFEPSKQRDLTETIQLLANMAKFVIADITDAKSIPQELSHIIPFLPSVPIQPILLISKEKEYAMFEHWRSFNTVLPEFLYLDKQDLLDNLEAKIIQPIDRWRKGQNEVSILQNRIKELETKISGSK